jgi:hypothetical protein
MSKQTKKIFVQMSQSSSSTLSPLIEKVASLKSEVNNTSANQTEYVQLAKQLLDDQSTTIEVNRYLLATAVDKTTNSVSLNQQVHDYFYVLFEWYKTGVDSLKYPLLRHVPICLYIEVMNKKHSLGMCV